MGRRSLTRAERNVAWIERFCVIPEGKRNLVGRPVVLRDWQRRELRKIYDNPAGTRQAIISFPRKNGKTALVSFLLLLHLAGPEAVPNSQLYSAAQSRDQAATVFKLASKIVRMSPALRDVVVIRDTAKELICPELGTYYAALSADKSTAHGKSPVFACHDELGQVRGPVSELYDAVETGMGAHEAPLSIIISTQAPTDNDLLSRLIDDARSSRDLQTVVSIYSAPIDADPFSEKTLKACNPAWGDFLNADEVLRTMKAAKAMPSGEAAFRNLHLNQRIELHSPFITKTVWDRNATSPLPFDRDQPVYGGLDLSAVRDITALALVGFKEEKWHVHPHFWLPGDGLIEKSRADRVPYDLWHKQGFLKTAPGASVDYEYVAEFIHGLFEELNIVKIGFDRKFMEFLKPWLSRVGFDDQTIEERFHSFGQGWVSMTPALRFLETETANGRLAHGNHPVLTMCCQNAVVKGEEHNRILAKKSKSARIDGMVALAMAMGVAPMQSEESDLGEWLKHAVMV